MKLNTLCVSYLCAGASVQSNHELRTTTNRKVIHDCGCGSGQISSSPLLAAGGKPSTWLPGDLAEQARRRTGTCQVLLGCARILPRAARMRWDYDEIVVPQTDMLGDSFPPSAWIATARCMRQDLSIPRTIIKYR